MATIRAYTTIEQSRKLAEILPLETADMYYACGAIAPPDIMIGNKQDYRCYTICWSLAALLDVLPKNLNIGRPSLESNYKGYYWIQYYDEFMQPNNYKTECFNNLIFLVEFSDENKATKEGFIKFTNKLKSLRPQNRWKPSESDILLLEKIANGKSNPQDFQASLWGLIGQLKKLRE